MIPAFDATGALPAGIHRATWAEIVAHYGYNPRRAALLRGLEIALGILRQAGCGRVYLGGSFITDKTAPGDFDACWEITGVDVSVLHPILLTFDHERALQKAVFGGELFPAEWDADGQGTSYLDFFQQDSRTLRRVGIIAIDLRGNR